MAPLKAEVSVPDDSWTVVQIKQYLDDNGIAYKSTDNKTELLVKAGV